ncbi:hypothetical protein LPJ56_004175 [Coemansia sp. RSA 2599]|nr:hypothetical protein LPJ75_003990 [Coemansia sp. RSA 2598]KAJ1816953.1 hypothetical protein LPJ56_004175 [Coemansia sp. RSA 2599]
MLVFIVVAAYKLALGPAAEEELQPVVAYSKNLPTPLKPIWETTQARHVYLANGCFLFITRTMSLTKVRRTMFDIQRRFNDRYGYPYVFLSEQPLSEQFQESVRYMAGPNASVEFGLIEEDWGYPEWIVPERAEQAAVDWADANDLDADRAGYRHMVRYWAGPFARHPLVQKYRYMWRLEPGSHYTCDFDYDPFVYLESHGLSYGFAISFEEMPDAVPSLARAAREFVAVNADVFETTEKQKPLGWSNSLGWMFDMEYNRCQFLTNSEVVDLDFVRSNQYRRLFDHLDRRGGIYYERWSDATVRSLAVAMFLNSSQVRWLDDVGYKHDLLNNCPTSVERQMRCACDPAKSSHHLPMSCSARWSTSARSIDPNDI